MAREVTATFEPARAYCTRCRAVFPNIDGCPTCGTDRYLTSSKECA